MWFLYETPSKSRNKFCKIKLQFWVFPNLVYSVLIISCSYAFDRAPYFWQPFNLSEFSKKVIHIHRNQMMLVNCDGLFFRSKYVWTFFSWNCNRLMRKYLISYYLANLYFIKHKRCPFFSPKLVSLIIWVHLWLVILIIT